MKFGKEGGRKSEPLGGGSEKLWGEKGIVPWKKVRKIG